jgi:hypothetical protein
VIAEGVRENKLLREEVERLKRSISDFLNGLEGDSLSDELHVPVEAIRELQAALGES